MFHVRNTGADSALRGSYALEQHSILRSGGAADFSRSTRGVDRCHSQCRPVAQASWRPLRPHRAIIAVSRAVCGVRASGERLAPENSWNAAFNYS